MSSISIVSLLRDYEVKDVKVHTFKLKHEDNEENETFDVEKSDGITIEMLFNTVLSFQTMSTRMAFTGPLMYSYFDIKSFFFFIIFMLELEGMDFDILNRYVEFGNILSLIWEPNDAKARNSVLVSLVA